MDKILQTRILPKKISGKIIPRYGIISKLEKNKDKSLILICSPAGYGKTTIILEFLEQYDYRFSWLNVHPEMDNYYIFMKYLLSSIEKSNNNFGKSTLALIDDYKARYPDILNSKNAINDISETFINELHTNFKDDIYIVIDDLGQIGSSAWFKKAFNELLQIIPSNVHFVISTRLVPSINEGVLNAKRRLFKIGMRELSFSSDETKTLVNEFYGIICSENEIKDLSGNLGGWITGLHLVLQSYGSSFKDLRLDKVIILDNVFNFFTEDIFNNLDDRVKDFLLFSSMLDDFTSEMCNELFTDINSSDILNELLQKNIFIQINPGNDTNNSLLYSYQVLFKRFLSSRLKISKTETEIYAFLRSASEYHLKKNEIISVVNYSIAAKDIQRSVELVILYFQVYFDKGNYEVIWKWLNELGEEIISRDYKLLYFKSLLLKFYIGNIEESLLILDNAIELCKENNDTAFYVRIIISKSRSLISLGKVKRALAALKEVDVPGISNNNRSNLLFLEAFAYYQNAEYEKALNYLNDAVKLLDDEDNTLVGINEIKMEIFNLYGHIFLIRGYYSKSIAYYERVVNYSGRISGKFETICNLILLYSQSGKFEKAQKYLEQAEELIKNISIPIIRITYLLSLQAYKFEYGDFEESIRLLEEMNRIALELNHKYYIFLSYSLIADCYLSLGRSGKAEEFYDMAFRFLNDNNELEKIQYSVSKAQLLKLTDPIAEIEPVLMKAYEYYDSNKIIYNKTQIAFHLADFYYKKGNLKTTICYLEEALTLSEENDYISFIQRELINFRPLFDLAMANGIKNSFLNINIHNITEKWKAVWISPECRQRLKALNEKIFDIKLNLMGNNDVYIRGKLLGDSLWTKKKWKLIFIYLLLSPKQTITKDKIIDIFYPDTSAESADNIFHQLISKFRNLIKFTADNLPADEGKKKSSSAGKKKISADEIKLFTSMVIYEDKLLKINPDLNYYIDSAEFEKLYKNFTSDNNPETKIDTGKKAISLYKGDFMEGNYETWCEEIRTKYRSYLLFILEEIIKLLFTENNYASAIQYAEDLLKQDSLNLTGHEYIIRSMVKMNRSQIAKVRYSQFVKNYKKELDENLPHYYILRIESVFEKQ